MVIESHMTWSVKIVKYVGHCNMTGCFTCCIGCFTLQSYRQSTDIPEFSGSLCRPAEEKKTQVSTTPSNTESMWNRSDNRDGSNELHLYSTDPEGVGRTNKG